MTLPRPCPKLLALASLLIFLTPLRAQSAQPPATFSLITGREPIASLVGQWRFHSGDDPTYANATFNDTAWPLLRSNEPWSTQGYKNLSGFAWYRFRITLPEGDEPLSLLLPTINTSWQCFIDGRLALSTGAFPPTRVLYEQTPIAISLPRTPRTQPQTLTISLRVWHAPIWASYVGGGPEEGSETTERLGATHDIDRFLREAVRLQRFNYSAKLDLAALDILAALASFALFFLRRSEREYLWFGIAVFTPAITFLVVYISFGHPIQAEAFDGLELLTRTLSRLAYIAFFLRLLAARSTWFLRFAIAGLILNVIPLVLLEGTGTLSVGIASLLGTLCGVPFELWVLGLLFTRWRQRVTDARLLLIPVALIFGLTLLADLLDTAETLGHPSTFSLRRLTLSYPFPIPPTDLAAGLFLLAMLAILIHRFARTSRLQDRIAADLEAARTLQQVLIPETLPIIPGLSIATAYYPAQEVGGDFFQILPLPSGDTLIVLGDVSGKGLPAAMTVSLAVGALRTLVDYTESPAAILTGLNQRLLGRGTGFTTCLVLRLSSTRLLTLSNAGHLAPYRNGKEIPTEPSLPLGIDPAPSFPEQTLQLNPGDHLTLLTDGIPEATSRRELFGFDRTQNLSTQPAAFIADAARSFGQSDDITVLTLDLALIT